MFPRALISIDPGEHTGWCYIDVRDDAEPEITEHGIVYPADYRTIPWLWDNAVLTASEPVRVLCERWINVPYIEHPVNSEVVQQQVGVLRYLSDAHEVPLELPVPQARQQVTTEILRSSGYFLEGKDYIHVRQAVRHALSWLVAHGHAPTIKRLYPREPLWNSALNGG